MVRDSYGIHIYMISDVNYNTIYKILQWVTMFPGLSVYRTHSRPSMLMLNGALGQFTTVFRGSTWRLWCFYCHALFGRSNKTWDVGASVKAHSYSILSINTQILLLPYPLNVPSKQFIGKWNRNLLMHYGLCGDIVDGGFGVVLPMPNIV